MGIYGDDYNPELARELAEKSGLTDKEILLINNGTSAVVLMCELIQANLKDIGVTCVVNNLDMGSWTTYLFDDTQYDMCIDGVPSAGGFISGAYHFAYRTMAASSYANYDFTGKERAFELVLPILGIADEQERIEMNLELTEICIDAMLWYNIVDGVNSYAMSTELKGDPKNNIGMMVHWRHLS
jgi:ABC-type transport system substrate-binding protein